MFLAAEIIPGLPQGLAGLGIVAVALLVGQIVTYRFILLPERARADRYEAEIQRLNTVAMEKLIPAMVAATATLAESQALIEDMSINLRRDLMGRERNVAE